MRHRQMLLPSEGIFDCQLVLESLMYHLPAHVYWKNVHGVYIGCNDRQAKSLGLSSSEEVIGKTDFELPWSEELANQFWENDRQVFLTGVSKTIEEVSVIDSEEAIVWSLKVPLKTSEGHMVGVLGISIDITQQKRAEAKLIQAKENLEAACAAKTQFLENMRHDIRTPMSGIRGCIQLIQDELQSKKIDQAKIEEYVSDLDISSAELLRLFNKMTSSVQAIHGAFVVKKERFNLENHLMGLIKLNQAHAKQKGLRLFFKHDDQIPVLLGDSERIERIVLELLTNALNFTDQGEVIVSTELAKQDSECAVIKIKVQDTGLGLSFEKQLAIFTRSHHVSPSYQSQSPCTGLGLSLVKQMIDELNGEIYVKSKENEGTIFTCVFPLKVALLSDVEQERKSKSKFVFASRVESNAKTEVIQSSGPIRVLLVEDDRIVRKTTEAILTYFNCEVEIAEDGRQALEKVKLKPYALILLDIGLPDQQGDEVASTIRQDNNTYNQATPIIAVTAHLDHESKKIYTLAGINMVLSKPLSKETVREILQFFGKG